MKLAYRVARSIHELDEAQWDLVAGEQIALTHRWQRVMEAGLRNYHPLYLLVEDHQGPLAVALANPTGFLGGTGRQEAWLRRVALVLGPAYSSLHCGLAVRAGAPLAEALPSLTGTLLEVCRQEKRLLCGISNVPAQDLPAWRACGFRVLGRPPLCFMDLPWDSYEAYLAARSYDARRRLVRMRRQAQESGAGVHVQRGVASWEGKLYPLLCEVYEHHGTKAQDVPFGEGFFSALEREMPGETVLWLGQVQGELAGFALGWTQGQEAWAAMLGLHYELARPHAVYFLLLDEIVRWCIGQGYRRLYTGLTAYEAKEHQGFRLQPRWFCFRAGPPWLDSLFSCAWHLVQALRQRKD